MLAPALTFLRENWLACALSAWPVVSIALGFAIGRVLHAADHPTRERGEGQRVGGERNIHHNRSYDR